MVAPAAVAEGDRPFGTFGAARQRDARRLLTAMRHAIQLAGMSDHEATPADLSRLLGAEYWVVLAAPAEGVDRATIDAHRPAHVAWLLELERSGVLFLAGPLTSGPGVGPGSGLTVLRVADEAAAIAIAASDPYVQAGLRTVTLYGWRLNLGSVAVRVSLGTGTYRWD